MKTAAIEFADLVHAEWTKFRTVRGWVVAVAAGALVIIAFGLAPGQHGSCNVSSCAGPTGPGGEQVSDSFYFVHQPLDGNGSITARVTSLTGQVPVPAEGSATTSGLVPWAKAGIIIKASSTPGSAYAAMMVTGSHGTRMQDDFTEDRPGLAGPVSVASPRWLRLTRFGDAVTGYDSADGVHWAKVGTATLAGLPSAAQVGLFTTSPQYLQTSFSEASVSGGPSAATGVFDHVSLTRPGGSWVGVNVGGGGGGLGSAASFSQSAGTFTVTGSGDIAPSVSGGAGVGVTVAQTLIGTFAGLVILAVVGAMFMIAEYRQRLVVWTLAASPRRGRVLAAKAVVVGTVTFAAGLVSAAVAVLLGQRVMRDDGAYVYPASALTELRVIAGTAAVLAVSVVIALATGAILRRGAWTVAVVVTVIVLPYTLTVAVPVLPPAAADWLLRVTPAAAFAVQQTLIQYPQVSNTYTAAYGYFPLPPWAGLAVLLAWAALALALALLRLRRRDA